MEYIGIDGCKAGWFCIAIDEHRNWTCDIFPTISELINHFDAITLALIDIPIGLPQKNKRNCDIEARKKLTRTRSTSVFPIPSRNSIYASDYWHACELNLLDLGVKVSKQTWNISDKIREVDQFILQNHLVKSYLKEAHPELNFWGWNYKNSMKFNKKSKKGIKERYNLLKQNLNITEDIFNTSLKKFPRKSVLPDDIIDAMILALSALHHQEIQSIPSVADFDSKGIKMEINFYEKEMDKK